MNQHPLLSVIVITYNSREEIKACLDAVLTPPNDSIELVVIDNNSPDDTASLLRSVYSSHSQVRLFYNTENTGFARACNQGVGLAMGKYILLLNPDTVAPAHDLLRMVSYMEENPDVGVLGPRIIDEHGVVQESYGYDLTPLQELIGKTLYSKHAEMIPGIRSWKKSQLTRNTVSEVGWIGGACMLMRRELYQEIGGIDPYFFFSHGDMIDLGKRVKDIGYKIVLYPQSEIVHTGSKSVPSNRDEALRSAYLGTLYYFKKYYGKGTVLLVEAIYVISSFFKAFIAFPLSLVQKNPYRGIARAHGLNAWRIITGSLEKK